MDENYYNKKVILVTGGAGAIGSNLVRRFSNLNAAKVIVFDNLSSSYQWNIPDASNVLFIKGDIRDENDLKRAFRHRPQIVFHLAAFFANQNSVDYPIICTEVNSIGTLKLLEYATLSNCVEKFIYTNSEGGAYGVDSKLPYKEHDISLKLGSPYYISKMSAESYCYYYQNQFELPVSVLRLFNSYGPGEVPGQYRNVIPNFIYWALKGYPLPLTGDERISRDFVFVDDTVEAIVRAGYKHEAIGREINVASESVTMIYELAKLINEKTNNKAGVKILKQRKWDSRISILGDSTVCSEVLGFSPQPMIDLGLDKTIEWFRANWKNIEASAEFAPGINPAHE